jgi:hypothetical protein
MNKNLIFIIVLSFLLTGCGLIPISHTLKTPSEETILVKDKNTGLTIEQAIVSYALYEWENWIKPLEFQWEIEDCSSPQITINTEDKNKWNAQSRNYGVYRFPQRTKVGWSKFWGIGPLGSWLYDTYQGYYYICAPGYHGISFSDNLHSNGICVSEFISFEQDKIVVFLVPATEGIPLEKRSYRRK